MSTITRTREVSVDIDPNTPIENRNVCGRACRFRFIDRQIGDYIQDAYCCYWERRLELGIGNGKTKRLSQCMEAFKPLEKSREICNISLCEKPAVAWIRDSDMGYCEEHSTSEAE